jgi:hypothetical protein
VAADTHDVVDIDNDELAGEALPWAIETHSRAARIVVSLRPAFRGRSLGTDVLGHLSSEWTAVTDSPRPVS